MNIDTSIEKAVSIRIQRKRIRGWRMPPNTVYVGRPSKWGNPYPISPYKSEARVIAEYENWLVSHFNMNDIRKELKGKNLACWCSLESACHADVLLEIANK